MTASATLLEHGGSEPSPGPHRLIVAWQHPESRAIQPVAVLDNEDGQFRFRYLERATSIADFRPFVGFPDLHRAYESPDLFPLFKQRVMNPRRPDYLRYVHSLDLPANATPWEQLARSGGQRVGDTIQLFPVPSVAEDGSTSCCFLVHGVRHRESADPAVRGVIDELEPGDALHLVPDPTNPKNPRAILVATGSSTAVGWVPDLLLEYTYALRAPNLTVEHVNREAESSHFRLLARMSGTVAPDFRPFVGPSWALASDL